MKMLKGTILKNAEFYEFFIYISTSKEVEKEIIDVLTKKLQQKGWIPNVQ